MLRLISYEFSVWLPNGINTGNGCSYLNLEFIDMFYIHVNPHSSPQRESILAIIAVEFISDFFGMFYIDVNLESGWQMVLILATIAIICSCMLIIILVAKEN